MSGEYKWFVGFKQGGYVDFVSLLDDDYEDYFDFPSTLWHEWLGIDVNHVELIDAQGNVHTLKMVKEYAEPVCLFMGVDWVPFISRFTHLEPKYIHLDQIDLKTFSVNFYTKDGNEVDYRFTKNHVPKCLVVGCHDPNTYQPVPHDLILNSRSGRDAKHVDIAFDGVVSSIVLYSSMIANLRKPAVLAFTGPEWERVVERERFTSSKLIVISSDEYHGSLAGKVLDGVLPVIDTFPYAAVGTSNTEKGFVARFGSTAATKGYMSIPPSFHEHKISGEYREVWLKAGGRSLYMCARIHTDKRLKSEKNKNVMLVGEMDRLKEALHLADNERMRFVLVSGDITSNDKLFFNVFKVWD